MKRMICTLSLLFSVDASAADLGVLNNTFDIIETDAELLLMNRTETFSAERQKLFQEKSRKQLEEPRVVVSFYRATDSSKRIHYPGVDVKEDKKIKLEEGKEFLVKKGTKENYFEKHKLSSKYFLFIDGRDEAQIEFTRKILDLGKKTTVMLLAGKPFEIEKRLQHKMDFDQDGSWSEVLNIKAVPSLIYQENDIFIIEEVSLKDQDKVINRIREEIQAEKEKNNG